MEKEKKKTEAASVRSTERKSAVLGNILRIGAMGLVAIAPVASTPSARAVDLSPYLSVDLGATYEQPAISSISAIPLSLRNVPINPADTYVPPGNAGPITKTSLEPSPMLNLMNVEGGGQIGFLRATNDDGIVFNHIKASAGVGLDLGLPVDILADPNHRGDTAERNYTTDVGSADRGYGAALTYEQVDITYPGGTWNDFMRPSLFAKFEVSPSTNLTLGVGVRLAQEDLYFENGWDRYDSLQTWRTYKLGSYYTAMPNVSIKGTTDDCYVELTLGFSEIIGGKETDFGRSMQVNKGNVPWFIGLEFGASLP